MRATIRQIATEAGVSHVTVSHVLRGAENRSSAETRERILEAAQRLNYIPVKPPTSQNHHIKTGMVTLVPEHWDIENHEFDLRTYQGVVRGAREYGYDVITMVNRETEHWERPEIRYLDRRSDGFIFAVSSQGLWEGALAAVSLHGIPTVVCYCREVPEGVAWVDVDNEEAIRLSVAHLKAHGHRRIAYLGGPVDNFDEHERRKYWTLTMGRLGLPVSDEVILRGFGLGYVLDRGVLASVAGLGVTAVVCFNDTLALALWDILEGQGVKVPEEISLIGMDNRPEGAQRGLTSVSHAFNEVGYLAMQAWMELQGGKPAAQCCRVAKVQFVERNSVGRLA